MKEIFEQYGGVLITVTAIVAVIGVMMLVITGTSAEDNGVIFKAFTKLIEDFMENAKNSGTIQDVTTETKKVVMLLPIIGVLF